MTQGSSPIKSHRVTLVTPSLCPWGWPRPGHHVPFPIPGFPRLLPLQLGHFGAGQEVCTFSLLGQNTFWEGNISFFWDGNPSHLFFSPFWEKSGGEYPLSLLVWLY